MDEKEHMKLTFDDRNSLNFWYPLIADKVLVPTTMYVNFDKWPQRLDDISDDDLDLIIEACDQLGYPCFMRTDVFSGKHNYERTCFIESEKVVKCHLNELLNYSSMCTIVGLPVNSIVIREFIEIEHRFKAFEGLPIGNEIRAFVREGEIECHHYYWPKASIKFYGEYRNNIPRDWETELDEMKTYCEGPGWEEIKGVVKEVAEIMNTKNLHNVDIYPSWSIDFAKGNNGKWYLIDMALGDVSYHPSHDPNHEEHTNRLQAGKYKLFKED